MTERHTFERGAAVLEPVSCLLCGAACGSEEELFAEHMPTPVSDQGLSVERLQEEYRKRVLFYEEKDGPFAVSGPELRRAASNYSWQATRSYQNGSSMPTYAKKVAGGEERALGTCPICVLSFWQEALRSLHLFTRPFNVDSEDTRPKETSQVDEDNEQAMFFVCKFRCSAFGNLG